MPEMFSTRNLFVLSVVILVASVVSGIALWKWHTKLQIQNSSQDNPLEGLEQFGSVPQFSLIERSGRRITLSDLKGHVWILNFIYTNCPDTCPVKSAQLREIQDEFHNEKDMRLVSITVDPGRDTPKILSEYNKRFSTDPGRWLFLTGEKQAIYNFAQNGFHLGAAELPHEKRPSSGATHTHSPRFVLVDREAQNRGYFVSTDPEAMKRLRRDVKTLLGDV
jgi:protein SCO1/2